MSETEDPRASTKRRNRRLGRLLIVIAALLFAFSFVYVAFLYRK